MVGERGTFLSDWTRGAHHAVDVGIMYVAHGLFGLDGMLRLYNVLGTDGRRDGWKRGEQRKVTWDMKVPFR